MKASDSELLSDTVSLEHEDIFKMVASLCFSGSLCVLSGKQAQSDGTSGAGMERQGDKILCVVINVLKSVKSDGAAFLME